MSKKLYVGNLGYNTSEAALGGLFGTIGAVASVNIITDRMTGRSRGFGFVEMEDDTAAQQAIAQLNGKTLDDRAITVAEARPQRTDGDRGPRREGSRDRRY